MDSILLDLLIGNIGLSDGRGNGDVIKHGACVVPTCSWATSVMTLAVLALISWATASLTTTTATIMG